MEIRFEKAEKLKEKPDMNNLGFGQYFTDYMGGGLPVGPAHSRTLRLERTLEHFDIPPVPATLELYDAYWDCILDTMTPRPGIREAMQHLKAEGKRIGIGTNMTAMMQMRKIERLGLSEYVDFFVTSMEPYYDKPEQRFFDLVAEKARCPREKILFIGDNKDHDYVPPRIAGMTSLWYRPDLTLSLGKEEPGDQIIDHHLEIFEKDWK